MQVRREDVSIFINSSVLYDGFGATMNIVQLFKTAVEEIDLQVKTPPGHIIIKIEEIGVVVYIFKLGYPAIMFTEQFGERSFARTDITRYSNMLRFLCFCHYYRVLSRFASRPVGKQSKI